MTSPHDLPETMDRNNLHTLVDDWSVSVFWKNGHACGHRDEWTTVDLGLPGNLSIFGFTRDDEHLYRRTLHAMKFSYERGRASKAKEIRQALGAVGLDK